MIKVKRKVAFQGEAHKRRNAAKAARVKLAQSGRIPFVPQDCSSTRRQTFCTIRAKDTHLQTEIGLKLQCRVLDLWPLVESLIRDLLPVSVASQTNLINAVPYDLAIYGDASLVNRIFKILTANAIKYTEGGEVKIGAHECGKDGTVECWVRDNGQGIPESMLDKVFDKGETDAQNNEGIGLGLAIVKTFTEAHGGHVFVESTYGSGAEFRFSLPGPPGNALPAC